MIAKYEALLQRRDIEADKRRQVGLSSDTVPQLFFVVPSFFANSSQAEILDMENKAARELEVCTRCGLTLVGL